MQLDERAGAVLRDGWEGTWVGDGGNDSTWAVVGMGERWSARRVGLAGAPRPVVALGREEGLGRCGRR